MSQQIENAKLVLSLTDLTSLNLDDTNQDIIDLCYKAINSYGTAAAVCVYPKFITVAKEQIAQLALINQTKEINVATVINFPYGDSNQQTLINQATFAINQGANEIDIVYPYQQLITNKKEHKLNTLNLLKQIKQLCIQANPQLKLKVIIESGELITQQLIETATTVAIESGADYVKTSTGKTKISATLDAATVILQTIKRLGNKCGFKASGGISTVADAMNYIEIARKINGDEYINPNTFRFGASGIYNDIINIITDNKNNQQLPFSGY